MSWYSTFFGGSSGGYSSGSGGTGSSGGTNTGGNAAGSNENPTTNDAANSPQPNEPTGTQGGNAPTPTSNGSNDTTEPVSPSAGAPVVQSPTSGSQNDVGGARTSRPNAARAASFSTTPAALKVRQPVLVNENAPNAFGIDERARALAVQFELRTIAMIDSLTKTNAIDLLEAPGNEKTGASETTSRAPLVAVNAAYGENRFGAESVKNVVTRSKVA